MKKRAFLLSLFLVFFFVHQAQESAYEILILGAAQDGGFPQLNCELESCCEMVHQGKVEGSYATSIAIINKETNKVWLIDCGPDFKDQFSMIDEHMRQTNWQIEGIFLTHAHIGHYTGLMQLGREVVSYKGMKVFVMPRMSHFLSNNGPWDQLVRLENIKLVELMNDVPVQVDKDLRLMPVLVPHRDEYSETVGYKVVSSKKSLLFIPDIDKWQLWDKGIADEVKKNDYAFLDATFYGNNDHPNRIMDSIPHPTVKETMSNLRSLSDLERNGVYFIHMNHTNPLFQDSDELEFIKSEGYHVAKQGMILEL